MLLRKDKEKSVLVKRKKKMRKRKKLLTWKNQRHELSDLFFSLSCHHS